MFSRIRHVAAVAVVVVAAISFTHQPAKAQTVVQLPASIAALVNAAMLAGNPDQVLVQLRAVLDANPGFAGAIATAAGQANPGLAQSIGVQAAQAVSASTTLTPAQKTAQVQLAARGLAAANPTAAADILTTISTTVSSDPNLVAAVTDVIADVAPAAGPVTPDPIIVLVLPDDDPVFTPVNENDITGS